MRDQVLDTSESVAQRSERPAAHAAVAVEQQLTLRPSFGSDAAGEYCPRRRTSVRGRDQFCASAQILTPLESAVVWQRN